MSNAIRHLPMLAILRVGCAGLCRTTAIVLLLCLAACQPEAPVNVTGATAVAHANVDTAVSMRGYNYTAEGVQEFYVNYARVSNLPPYGGGGKSTCCALLPPWHEGLTVTIDWTIGHYTVPYAERKHLSFNEQIRYWSARTLHQTVPVQRYDHPDTLQVFFLPDDKVEVWVSRYDLGHPHHPSGRAYPVDPDNPSRAGQQSQKKEQP